MQSQQQKKATVNLGSEAPKLDSFVPLLVDIRSSFGNHWTFYEECIGGVLDAAAKQQDTTAWFEQMQQLVEGIEKIHFSHEGIIFLLQDMGVHPPKQQSSGEGEGDTRKFHSPPLSPPEYSSQTPLLSIASMGPCPVRSLSTMSPLLCLRPFRPITPTIDDWPAPRGQQQQQQPRVLRYGVLPFDFSAPVQPGLTFPKDFRAYHCPPDQIALTENFALPPPYPLRESSSNPVLFSDSVLGADVAEAFGYTVSSKNGNYTGIGDIGQARQRLPYDVHDDDLMAWRTRLETGADSGDGVVKANGSMIDTWPPWNFRFDLEL